MKKIMSINYKLGLMIFLFLANFGCSDKKQAETVKQEITVVQVLQKDVPISREFVGEIYGEKDIPIRARVEGFLEGIHFEEGFKVKKGQLLYSIDPKPLESRVNAQQSKVAEAETMLAKAKSDLERYKPLAAQNAVSQSDLDAKQAQYDAAISSLEAAKANLKSSQIELGYTKVYSPINGIIGKTQAKVGDFVGREPNPVILNVVSETNHVKVNFFLTESEFLQVFREISKTRDIQHLEADERIVRDNKATLELILADGSVYDHKGMVDFIDRGIDATTGSILVQGDFPNPDLILRPGLYAKVKVEMEVKKDALLIPQRCVMELQGQYSVYVVNDQNLVETRQIEPGQQVGDYWLVNAGLKPNEKLVIDALQKVRAGMEITPVLTEFQSQNTPF